MIETISQMLYRLHHEHDAMEARFERRRAIVMAVLIAIAIAAIVMLWTH